MAAVKTHNATYLEFDSTSGEGPLDYNLHLLAEVALADRSRSHIISSSETMDFQTDESDSEAEPNAARTVKLDRLNKDSRKQKNANNNVGNEKSHKCKSCGRGFDSFRALGGHRASCKARLKLKFSSTTAFINNNNNAMQQQQLSQGEGDSASSYYSSATSQCEYEYFRSSCKKPKQQKQPQQKKKKKTVAGCGSGSASCAWHVCDVCSSVFVSGQALGGHKRSHFAETTFGCAYASATASASTNINTTVSTVVNYENFSESSSATPDVEDDLSHKKTAFLLPDLNLAPPPDEQFDWLAVKQVQWRYRCSGTWAMADMHDWYASTSTSSGSSSSSIWSFEAQKKQQAAWMDAVCFHSSTLCCLISSISS